MWMLRFNNGVTSVGITSRRPGVRLDVSRYPSLSEMFREAKLIAPAIKPDSTRRIQRLYDPVVGNRCLMLPTAAVTIDPLHSTGIAHALAGVDRIAELILGDSAQAADRGVEAYRDHVVSESLELDRMVDAAYRTMHDFSRFTAACMLYFAAAIRCEERYLDGQSPPQLWNTDDADFVLAIRESCERLISNRPTASVVDDLRQLIEPWNTARLFDPSVDNRYAYTATKRAP
jgi:FADH2 O2-dependent halogenase